MRAFLGLGSNLGDRRRYLRDGVAALPDVVAVSPVYETDPVGGPPGQGAYLNLVVELDTDRVAPGAARGGPGGRGGRRPGPAGALGPAHPRRRRPARRRPGRSTSPTWSCPTPACGSGPSCWCRWPTWPPSWSAAGPVLAKACDRPVRCRRYERHPGDGGRNVSEVQLPTGHPQPRLRIIGPGRAGLSLARALAAAGWAVAGVLGPPRRP